MEGTDIFRCIHKKSTLTPITDFLSVILVVPQTWPMVWIFSRALSESQIWPLIATKATAPVASGKPKFAGHICIEKHRLQLHRSHQMEDIRKAVSTSHCSQPNTIEYEMAMEWRLLQEKSECWWKELYKQENLELVKVKRNHLILTAKKKLDK